MPWADHFFSSHAHHGVQYVIEGCHEDTGRLRLFLSPLLVGNGSLYDVLHLSTLSFQADPLLSMLRDVVAGMTFLHTQRPMIIHGHLTSKVGTGRAQRGHSSSLSFSSSHLSASPFLIACLERADGSQPAVQSQ